MNKFVKWSKSAVYAVCFALIYIFLTANQPNEQCLAPAGWFTGASVPEPDPSIQPMTNCEFHQVSWQYFLWLTEEVSPGKLRFETMFNEESINPDTPDPTNHILGGVQQAESGGILVDQNGRAVYTNIIINNVYRDWIIWNKLYDKETYLNFPDTSNFPDGSISLKAGWKIVEEGEDVSDFYTTTASIQLLATENGKVVIPANPKIQENVKVALVSFHIAFVVKNHPEFVWATFEHIDNAPDFVFDQEMDQSVSEKDFTFYKAGTKAEDCNANNASILKLVDESKQILSPVSQVARQYRVGGGSSNNQNNIDRLNKSVHSQLAMNSVWKNYMEVGAVWFNLDNGSLVPNWTPNSDPAERITGSTKLSNSTIETFTQDVRSQNECFSCHNTMAVTYSNPILPGKNASTSHVLLKNYLGVSSVKR